MSAKVIAVHSRPIHAFSKATRATIDLVEGHGVLDDAHFGITVKHRSRVAKDPSQPNLRQVHLLHHELFAELATQGLEVRPGEMGENITTHGLRLLELSTGTQLRIGKSALVEVTGLRSPCSQIENFQRNLLAAVLGKTKEGGLVRKAGVMGIVLVGGMVQAEDEIVIAYQPHQFKVLQPV